MPQTETIDLIEDLIGLAEARIPANPRSPKNERTAEQMVPLIRRYFDRIENALPMAKIEAFYNKHVEIKEADVPGSDALAAATLVALSGTFEKQMVGELSAAYESGSIQMKAWATFEIGDTPGVKEAVSYARDRGATLVKGMDEETRRRLAGVVSRAIEEKRGIPGLRRDIREMFDDMSKHRADMIARTETSEALSQAFLDNAKAMGIKGKQWITAGDQEVEDICLGNEMEGIVPLNHTFSSGHDRPTAHPRCRCALAPANLPGT